MERKRILHMNMDNIRPSGTFSLVYGMIDFLPSDIAFDFLGDFEKNAYSEKIERMGGKVFPSPMGGNKVLRWSRVQEYVYNVCKTNKYETVHIAADTAYKALFFAKPARRAGVKKIIIESHSSQVNGKGVKIKKKIHRLYQPLLKKYCDICVACSDEAAKWMWKSGEKSNQNVHVIRNGINIDRFLFDYKKREKFRNKYNLEDKFVIGHISDFSPAKNPDFIIEIFGKIYEKNPNSMLLLVGNKIYKKEVLSKYANESFYKGILDIGQFNHTEFAYSAMDLYIQPSIFEGLPVAVVEASANGLDILLSEGISKDACILESTKSISTVEKEVWVENILKPHKALKDRGIAAKVMYGSVYDVKTTLKEFLDLYKD